MRVLCLTSNYPRWPGDSTTPFVLHLCQDLQARGVEMKVLAPHAHGAARNDVLGAVPVHRFRYFLPEAQQTVCYGGGALVNLRKSKVNAAKLPALVAAELTATIRELRRGQHTLLHSHWILPQGFVGVAAARPSGVPHVLTVHGGDVFGLRGRLFGGVKRAALEAADAVTVNSSATEAAVRALAPRVRRLLRIPMGVDVTERGSDAGTARLRERYRRGAGPLLLFVGRLVEEKGVEDLLRAVRLLAAHLPDLSAVLAGEGQDRQAFEWLARDLGVTDRVTFAGWVNPSELPDHLRAADAVLAPSRAGPDGWVEAQGLSLAESLALHRPVIATATGGIADTIIDGKTGLLVPAGSPESLAAAVRTLHGDPALSSRLAAAGRDHVVRTFSREVTADAFAALYRDLAGN